MHSSKHTSGPRPNLRLFQADESDADLGTFLTRQQRELVEREPRLLWKWRQFYEGWFCDAVLSPKHAEPATYDGYEQMLHYWEAITGDQPLLLTPDEVCIDFVGALPEWGWTCKGVPRGRPHRIGPLADYPSYWPLLTPTIKKHRDRLATLIRAAGPRYDPSHARARILSDVPYIPIVTAEWQTKPPFSIAEARQIAAAAGKMTRPELPAWLPRELWWQTRLAQFYYTGQRSGTVIALRWRHLEELGGESWLNIPGQIVKTGKPDRVRLHPQLVDLLDRVRSLTIHHSPLTADQLILPAGCGYRHFLTLHSELQGLAGLAEAQRQSPHAWRRTHLVELDRLGAADGKQAAQAAGNHASVATSIRSYVGHIVANLLRLELPPLF